MSKDFKITAALVAFATAIVLYTLHAHGLL